jgi:hypothetical protein
MNPRAISLIILKVNIMKKQIGESDKLTYNKDDKIREIQNKMFWTGVRVKIKIIVIEIYIYIYIYKHRNANNILMKVNCMELKVEVCNLVKFKITWVRFGINRYQDSRKFYPKIKKKLLLRDIEGI